MKLGFEIIWNVIESVGVIALKSFSNEDIINSLKKLFENTMKTGYKLEDKVNNSYNFYIYNIKIVLKK